MLTNGYVHTSNMLGYAFNISCPSSPTLPVPSHIFNPNYAVQIHVKYAIMEVVANGENNTSLKKTLIRG